MLNITLILGHSCSGKEVYLRHTWNGVGLRIGYEEFKHREPPRDLMNLLDALQDNWHVTIEGFRVSYLAELQEKHNVNNYVVTYAPLFILAQRRKVREDVVFDEKNAEKLYRTLLGAIDLSKTTFFNSFENTHHQWTQAGFWAEWQRINCLPTKADEEAFLQEMRDQDARKQDDHYAPIVLPHYTYKGGVKTTNPQATWDKIKELGVVFEGKQVIDIGCCEGFTLHRALEDGAINVLGLDAHGGNLHNAVKIAWLKQSPANFLFFNINHNTLWFANDMILCLNMLHYTNSHIALPKIFKATKEAVFEINNEQVPMVQKYAREHGFELVGKAVCRVARNILWFQRQK